MSATAFSHQFIDGALRRGIVALPSTRLAKPGFPSTMTGITIQMGHRGRIGISGGPVVLIQQSAKSLQVRVEDYLRVSTAGYEVKELGDDSLEALMQELREAEAQMALLQKRVTRLRELLVSMG